MAAPDSPGRILRIEDADTKADRDRREVIMPSKPCVVPGCTGTMHYHKPIEVARGAHTLEWPWWPSWRCAQDSTHVQTISPAEARQTLEPLYRELYALDPRE
jgi:hypothetical protein